MVVMTLVLWFQLASFEFHPT